MIKFENFKDFFLKPADDLNVQNSLRFRSSQVVRDENSGYVDLRDLGFSIALKEAREFKSYMGLSDGRELVIYAFHFYSEGYEGHSMYDGDLPVSFDETKEEILHRLGDPYSSGGGAYIALLRKIAPSWVKYRIEPTAMLHLQFDGATSKVDLITLGFDE